MGLIIPILWMWELRDEIRATGILSYIKKDSKNSSTRAVKRARVEM